MANDNKKTTTHDSTTMHELDQLDVEADVIDANFAGNPKFPGKAMAAVKKLFGDTGRQLLKILKDAEGVRVSKGLARQSIRELRAAKDTACQSLFLSIVQVTDKKDKL